MRDITVVAQEDDQIVRCCAGSRRERQCPLQVVFGSQPLRSCGANDGTGDGHWLLAVEMNKEGMFYLGG